MVAPFDLVYASIVGSFLGVGLTFILMALLMIWDLQRFVKDDASFHRRIWLTITMGPKHIYHGPDWSPVISVLPKTALLGALISPLIVIFAVGIIEIFLT